MCEDVLWRMEVVGELVWDGIDGVVVKIEFVNGLLLLVVGARRVVVGEGTRNVSDFMCLIVLFVGCEDDVFFCVLLLLLLVWMFRLLMFLFMLVLLF